MRRLLLPLAAAALVAVSARAANRPLSVLDPALDPRLARKVRLHAEGIPLRSVVEALEKETGISLRVEGAPGDERLVAFVPDAPVSEVLTRIADLYRLTWQREPGKDAAYRLVKPPRAAREEQSLRERSLRGLLSRLGERLRNPRLPLDRPSRRPEVWQPVYPALFPIILARGDELIREGYAYVRLGALPPAQREPLLERARPILKAEDDRRTEALNDIRRREIEMGIPEDQATAPKPPSHAEKCVFTVDLSVPGAPRASIGLRTDSETWYNWFEIDGDPLTREAVELYAGRGVRVPGPEAEKRSPTGAPDDPLARPVSLPSRPELRKGDWVGALARLSAAARVPIYADCYTSYQEGYGGHPRSKWTPAPRTTVEAEMDRLCFPRVEAGRWRREPNAFWWRREGSVLIRSRRWLWEAATQLPERVTGEMTASLRAHGRLHADDLPRLGGLGWLQVQALETSGRHMDIWSLGIRIPARLSFPARTKLTSGKLAWSDLSDGDRRLMAPFVADLVAQGRNPSAQIRVELRDVPEQGAVLAVMSYWPMGSPRGRSAYFALPGVDLKLQPRGLAVEAQP